MKRNAEVEARLKEIPLFHACSKDELARLAALCSHLSFPAGTVLATEGEVGREFLVISSGTVTVSAKGTTLADLGPGDFFGEVSLIDGDTRTATVTATSDVEVDVIEQRDFSALLFEVPSIARKLLIGVAKRLRAADLGLAEAGPSAP